MSLSVRKLLLVRRRPPQAFVAAFNLQPPGQHATTAEKDKGNNWNDLACAEVWIYRVALGGIYSFKSFIRVYRETGIGDLQREGMF